MSGEGKVVLVTGCTTGGIGSNLCEQFAAEKCKVYATSRKLSTMEGLEHPSIQKLALDVTSDEDFQRVVKTIIDAEGKIDIAISNAGALGVRPLIDLSLEQIKYTFDTNTFAALRMAKTVIPFMAQKKSGLLVNIGSIAGEVPTPWNGIYSASKAALHTITEVLQMECRPFNVDVMLVSPGAIKSNIANNQKTLFKLPSDSLYGGFIHNMIQRMNASQGANSMPTVAFAKLIVRKSLQKKPPFYITAGGNSTVFKILKWLPKTFLLWFMWKRFSGPAK